MPAEPNGAPTSAISSASAAAGNIELPTVVPSSIAQKQSFIRVRFCDRGTTVFLPFISNLDTGASLKAQLAAMRGGDAADQKLVLFSAPSKTVMEDSQLLTIHNIDQCSLWFCCTAEEFPTVQIPSVRDR